MARNPQDDKFVTQYVVEADDGLRTLRDLSDEEQKLAKSIDGVGDEAAQTSRQLDQLNDKTREADRTTDRASGRFAATGANLRSMATSIGAAVAAWVSLNAILNLGLGLINNVADAAKRAADNLRELGERTEGLATNIGGRRVDQLVPQINEIALGAGIGTAGRDNLIAALGSATDADPNLNNDQLLAQARGFANLQRGTSVGGQPAQQAVQAVQNTLGMSFDRAVDFTSVLLNSGLDAGTIEELVGRAGNVGGQDLVALLLAARGEMNLSRTGRSLPGLVNALSRTDDDGTLADDLEGLGLAPDMTQVDRIGRLGQLLESGQITDAQFDQAIGGTANRRLVLPLIRALPNLGAARSALDEASVQDEIARREESDLVRRAQQARNRELRQQLASEGFASGGDAVDFIEEQSTVMAERGGGSTSLGVARTFAEVGTGQTFRDLAEFGIESGVAAARRAAGAAGTVIIERLFVNHGSVNGESPTTGGLREEHWERYGSFDQGARRGAPITINNYGTINGESPTTGGVADEQREGAY